MKLFLDTEFNGFGGKLMSMALVPLDSISTVFYCELEMTDQLDPWVRDNVVPHMFHVPCSKGEFQAKLSSYLFNFDKCTIVADWPDDIKYFCDSLITGPGERIMMPSKIEFELNLDIEYESKIPHNALHDAVAIRNSFLK